LTAFGEEKKRENSYQARKRKGKCTSLFQHTLKSAGGRSNKKLPGGGKGERDSTTIWRQIQENLTSEPVTGLDLDTGKPTVANFFVQTGKTRDTIFPSSEEMF